MNWVFFLQILKEGGLECLVEVTEACNGGMDGENAQCIGHIEEILHGGSSSGKSARK